MKRHRIPRRLLNKVRAHFGGVAGLIVLSRGAVLRAQERLGIRSLTRKGLRTVLPPPDLTGHLTLEDVLARRRSIRDFSPGSLSLNELSQLFWAAQGVTSVDGRRTAPSSGGLYPLDVHVVTGEGHYNYDAPKHELVLQSVADLRPTLYWAAEFRRFIRNAPAIFVIVGGYEREAEKYGRQRSPLYVHLEAGHVAQNLLLQAVSLGLGGVPVGGFYESPVREALSLPRDKCPLYLVAIGHPANGAAEDSAED